MQVNSEHCCNVLKWEIKRSWDANQIVIYQHFVVHPSRPIEADTESFSTWAFPETQKANTKVLENSWKCFQVKTQKPIG